MRVGAGHFDMNILCAGTKKTIYWSRSQAILENVQLKGVCDGGGGGTAVVESL